VEPITAKIQTTYSPIAVIGTNTITSKSAENLVALSATGECVMMPTQWAQGADTDSKVGWSTDAFKSVMPAGQSTYHAASAAAAGIAIAHAMAAGTDGTRVGTIKDLIAAVDTKSFYGLIKFNSFGNILKPMYTEQHQGGVRHRCTCQRSNC